MNRAIPLAPGDVIFFTSSKLTHYNLAGDEDVRHSLTLFAHSDMLYENKHRDRPEDYFDIVAERNRKKRQKLQSK